MPPDITAGLMALAGAPPGVAASAGPSPPEPLGTSLFAAFLAQSSPPSVPPAAPKAAAPQMLTADPKQTPLEKQALLKKQILPDSKIMDTLPTLSFPVPPKPKADASELSSSQVLRHQKPAEDQCVAGKTPAPSVLNLALSLAGQAAVPPVLVATPPVLVATPPVLVATPILMTPAAAATAPTTAAAVSVAAVSVSSAPAALASSASAAPPRQTAFECAMPVLTSRSYTPVLTLPPAAAPGQATSALPAPALPAPAQTGLPLPRTWTLTAPVQTLPPQASPLQVLPLQVLPLQVLSLRTGLPILATAQATSAGQVPELKAASTDAAKPAAARVPQAANSLPRVPSPASPAPFQPVPFSQSLPLSQNTPPEALPDLSPPLAQVPQNTLTPSPAITVAAIPLAAPLLTRGTPVSPTKTTGKFLPAALKPAGENADTSTRTMPGQDQTGSVKTGAPAAAPEPMPEKHTEEQKPSLAADSGTNNALMSQATAPADMVNADKPLSATERTEVVRQVADQVVAMPLPAKPGTTEQIVIQLHPKDWGSLQVSVTVAPSQNAGAAKAVTAHIIAETPQIKAVLQSQSGALHQALRTSGMHLEHLTVSVKAPEVKAPEVKAPESKVVEVKAIEAKTAAQSASAELSPRQSRTDQSEQSRSFGQPGANTGSSGMGNSQNNRQGQPPPVLLSEPEAEDDLVPAMLPRPASGRIDTHA